MFRRVFAKYDQALLVAGCAMISFATIGWMVNDIHLREKRTIHQNYESKIKLMEEHIKTLQNVPPQRASKPDVVMA
jgi:hypothetical protein